MASMTQDRQGGDELKTLCKLNGNALHFVIYKKKVFIRLILNYEN